MFMVCMSHVLRAETSVFDCKIEGHKTADNSKELVVCSVRQNGDFIGTILLRGPNNPDSKWDTIVSPAVIRAVHGDKIYFRLCCAVSPRIKPAGGYGDFVNVDGIKGSEWGSLQVSEVREIPETEFLGIASKTINPR